MQDFCFIWMVHLATRSVVAQGFFEGRQAAIVHVWRSHGNIPQREHPKVDGGDDYRRAGEDGTGRSPASPNST